MLNATMRLALITVAALILLVLGVFFMRQTGLRQGFAEPPHPWFAKSEWVIYKAPREEVCAMNFKGLNPDWIVAIEAEVRDRVWGLNCPELIELSKFFDAQSHQNFLIEVNSQNNQDLMELVKQLSPLQNRQFAVSSRSQRTVRMLRKEAPTWLFAADSSTMTRLHLFSSLWLESAFDFWPDFVIANAEPQSPFHLSEREAAELSRRKKRILWDTLTSKAATRSYPVHGVMTDQRKLP